MNFFSIFLMHVLAQENQDIIQQPWSTIQESQKCGPETKYNVDMTHDEG